MTLVNDIHSAGRLPPKALARKIMDAAVAEAEAKGDDDYFGLFVRCDIGKVGDLDVVVTHNDLDGARAEIWSDRHIDVPEFSLDADEVSALVQTLLTAKFAVKMLNKELGEAIPWDDAAAIDAPPETP